MRYCICLTVYDPRDLYSRSCALPSALESVEKLSGDFSLRIAVNAAERCPRTVMFLQTWCDERPWATMQLHTNNDGIAAAFNASVKDALADYDAFVFMSGDALLTDRDVLETFSAAFLKWPRVGALHPVSVFEDAADANFSREWDLAQFHSALDSYRDASLDDLEEDPFAERASALSDICRQRTLNVTRPHLVLPLTFWAVRRSVLETTGLMDERWRFCYENMDFALRSYIDGAESAVLQNTFVFHRRLLFRLLGSYDLDETQTAVPDIDGEALWLQKWGCAPGRAWDEARYGVVVSTLSAGVRRIGTHLLGWNVITRFLRAILRRLNLNPLNCPV